MAIATLAEIILKVRRLTGSGNSLQLTDAQIIDYINSFYLYDFPAQFRSLKLKDKYTFNTVQGIDTYPFDSEHYTTVEMPVYCAKREIKLMNDPWSFYALYFNWQQQETFAIGDGTPGAISGVITNVTQANPANVTSVGHGLTTGNQIVISNVVGMTELNGNTYSITVVGVDNFTLNVNSTSFTPYISGGTWTKFAYNNITQNSPIIRSVNNNAAVTTPLSPTTTFPTGYPVTFPQANISRVQNILITANTATSTLNVTDDGNGNLIGDCIAGTINYQTGAIAGLIFTANVPQGNEIQIQYNPVQESIPLAIMFFQNQFTLRPVPDKGYTIELVAYRQPSQALLGSGSVVNSSGVPELSEWWETIAFGAAKKVYEDRLDPDGVALMDKALFERYALNETRTYAQLGKQRIGTIYADQLTNSYGNSGWGFGSGGSS